MVSQLVGRFHAINLLRQQTHQDYSIKDVFFFFFSQRKQTNLTQKSNCKHTTHAKVSPNDTSSSCPIDNETTISRCTEALDSYANAGNCSDIATKPAPLLRNLLHRWNRWWIHRSNRWPRHRHSHQHHSLRVSNGSMHPSSVLWLRFTSSPPRLFPWDSHLIIPSFLGFSI
jgi:hypothetical protein